MRQAFYIFVFILLFCDIVIAQSAFLLEYRTGSDPVSDEGTGIQKTSDGGYILGGRRDPTFSSIYDFQLIKINSAGTVLWSYSYDVGGSEELTHVRQTTDGGYFLYGKQGADIIAIKTDNSGTPLWGWRYAGMTTVEPSKCREEIINPDGGYILAGAEIGLGSGGGFRDGYLLRLNSSGALRWAMAYGLNTREDFFNDLAEDDNGRWSVAANYGIGASSNSVWFLIDSIGTTIKRQQEITTGAMDYFSASYVNTSASVASGKYFLSGRVGTNVYIVRTRDGALPTTRYSRSITVNDGSGYSTEAYSIDSVNGENALWLTGRITGAIAVDAASLEMDFLFVKVNMNATLPFAPTTIATCVAVGTATYNESPNEGTIVSPSECIAVGTNYGDPMSPGASPRIKLAKSNTGTSCDYRDLTSVTSLATTGASAAGSSPTITDITGSMTATSIPLGSITQVNLFAGTSTTTNCFLPVTLLSYSGKTENNSVKLFWSTGSEQNNDFFTIERSVDGITFSEIGKVNGAGNSSTNRSYEFIDESPSEENYYRLSQTDFNGQQEKLGIISVMLSNKSDLLQLTIQSSPVTANDLLLNFYSPFADEISLFITDFLGRTMRFDIISLVKNETKYVPVDLTGISNGTYFIRASGKNSCVNSKFILLNRE